MWTSGMHALYNDSSVRPKEFHFVLSGKDAILNRPGVLSFEAVRCYDPCIPPVVVAPIEKNYRLWS